MKNNLVLKVIIGVLIVTVAGLAVKLAMTNPKAQTNVTETTTTVTIPPTTVTLASATTATTQALGTPFIKIVSPNGGEIFKEGQNIPITWTSKGINDVYISAYYYGANNKLGDPSTSNEFSFNAGECRLTYEPVPATSGMYIFKNDTANTNRCSKMPIGSRIKIEISSQTPKIVDTSDNYFSIVK